MQIVRQLKREVADLRAEQERMRETDDERPARYAQPGEPVQGDSRLTGVLSFGGEAKQHNIIEIIRTTQLFHPPTNSWLWQMDMHSPPRMNMAVTNYGSAALCLGGLSPNGETVWTDRFVNGGWSSRTSFPILSGRQHWPAATISARIYVCGGYVGHSGIENDLWRYRYTTDNWLALDNMPFPERGEHVAFAVDDKFYVCGGEVPLPSRLVDRFDPAQNTWATRDTVPRMDTLRVRAAAVTLGGYGHVFGGRQTTTSRLQSIERYDHVANTWSTKTDMPSPGRDGHGAAVFGDRAYLVGGQTNDALNIGRTDEYNPDTQTWSTRQNIPGPPRRGHGVAAQ
jgi:N-acetylneuraminic acid mutarotase